MGRVEVNVACDDGTYQSTRKALQALGVAFGYDERAQRPVLRYPGEVRWSPVTDRVFSGVRQRLSDQGFNGRKDHIVDAIYQLAYEHPFDPVCVFLDSLEWDGKERLAGWLHRYCGAEDTELNQAIGIKTLVAAVRRARHPACKHDEATVLIGPQACGKSRGVRALAVSGGFRPRRLRV